MSNSVNISKDISVAKKLLKENGYIVKKITKRMKEDCNQCEELNSKGECMDCLDCSCNICVTQ